MASDLDVVVVLCELALRCICTYERSMGDERFQRAGAGSGELLSPTTGSVAAGASCGTILNYYLLLF